MYVRKPGAENRGSRRLGVRRIIEHSFMSMDRIECSLAALAVLCVLTIFFFPAMQGPYPVVHGPVTALLSVRAAAALRFRIVRAALSSWRERLRRTCAPLALSFWIPFSAADFQVDSLAAGCSSILRC
jgi:hypothetical protein